MAFATFEGRVEFGVTFNDDHDYIMPATVNAGDLLIICAATSSSSAKTMTNPSGDGFTEIYNLGSANQSLAIFAKVADGDEDGATVTVLTSAACEGAGHVLRYSNWFGAIAGLEASSRTGGTSNSPNPASLTASWGADDNTFIAVAGAGNDDATVSAYPSGYGNTDFVVAGGGTNSGCTMATCDKQSTSATDDPGTFTLSETEVWNAITLVIRPAAAGGLGIPQVMHHRSKLIGAS